MCGIAGYIGKEKIDAPVIKDTLDLMMNRGPDCQNYQFIENNNTRIYLLSSRLSIIDLNKAANQPFVLNGCTLIFNGEIYNYIELREELKKNGIECRTKSDTEVLLRYYILYGEECVKYFEGMWSFAIYDNRYHKLFISRDRFAEKPLYYYQTKNGFYFGSETKLLKSLCQRSFPINQKHLLRYLAQGYKSLHKTKETFFENLYELKYATNCVVDQDANIRTNRYWTPKSEIDMTMSRNDAVEGAKHHLLNSVKIRLRSDVPLAFCLSGGVDSAALVSIASKNFNYNVNSFSIIDSDERYNEFDNIKATVEDTGCKSNFIKLSYNDSLCRLKKLIAYHDAPVATITYFIHSMLSEKIAQNGYKVAFSGTSADELFTGYYDHFLLHLYSVKDSVGYLTYLKDWEKYILRYVRNPFFRNPTLYMQKPGFRDHIYDNCLEFLSFLKVPLNESFTEENFAPSLLRNRMLNELFHENTPLMLHEDDLNSALYSIENRSPYLDSRLFEFVYSIPDEYLIQNGYGKYILRSAVNGILNDTVRLDRRKKGFNASINSIFDLRNKNTRNFILDPLSPIFDLIDRKQIAKLLELTPIPNHYSKFIFSFINAKIFIERN